MDKPSGPVWSDAVEPAAWIADRLSDFGTTVTSIAPSGFELYTRMPHPVETPEHGDKLVRWKEVESAMASACLADSGQTPNLGWPEDRSWFVASDIDLAWTYVRGAEALIEALVSDDRIEAIPADPYDVPCHIEDWLKGVVERAADELLVESGMTTIRTLRGTVPASFDRPNRFRAGELRAKTTSGWGGGFGQVPLRLHDSR